MQQSYYNKRVCLRVVMVAPFAIYPKGTIRIRMLPIARELTTRGYEVSILIPPYDNPSESGREYRIYNVTIHNVVFEDLPLIKYFLPTIRMIVKIFTWKPQIIHVFKPKGYSGLVAMFIAMAKRLGFFKETKLVLDMDDWEGYGGFCDLHLKYSVHTKPMLDFIDYQEKWIPKRVDTITVASKTLKKRALELGIPSNKIFYVPNAPSVPLCAVDSEDVKKLKKKLGLKNEPLVLLYTRFFEYRIEKIIDVLKHVKKELSDVKLLVVGKGNFREEEELKELALREGLGDSILFAGWIQPNEIPIYLAVGDVAIYPFDDTLLNRAKCPGKLIELMSAGKAIVADKVGQICEYVQDGKSGLLADPTNYTDFAKKVVKVIKDRDLREKLGKNARKRIWDVFDWRRLTSKVEQAYDLTPIQEEKY